VVGPGGPTGKYIRQCKRAVTTASSAGLCLAHERMMRRIQARDYTVKALRLSGKLRRSSVDLGTVDPRAVLVTIKEWNALTVKPDFATNAVYTLEDALMPITSKPAPSKPKEKKEPPKKEPPKREEETENTLPPKTVRKITREVINQAIERRDPSFLKFQIDNVLTIIRDTKDKSKAAKQIGHVLFLGNWFIDHNGDFIYPDDKKEYIVWSMNPSIGHAMKFSQLQKFYDYIRTHLPSSYTFSSIKRYEVSAADVPKDLYSLVQNSAKDSAIKKWYTDHGFKIN
jgi:hypothetical protein